jgi:hypothetical protein
MGVVPETYVVFKEITQMLAGGDFININVNHTSVLK